MVIYANVYVVAANDLHLLVFAVYPFGTLRFTASHIAGHLKLCSSTTCGSTCVLVCTSLVTDNITLATNCMHLSLYKRLPDWSSTHSRSHLWICFRVLSSAAYQLYNTGHWELYLGLVHQLKSCDFLLCLHVSSFAYADHDVSPPSAFFKTLNSYDQLGIIDRVNYAS